ncbi:ankyrin repeat domain-containing protein [bacterium]|nr:ankyrin repeat domain-containing protein [candidate division CSSED10-310 bacterium]
MVATNFLRVHNTGNIIRISLFVCLLHVIFLVSCMTQERLNELLILSVKECDNILTGQYLERGADANATDIKGFSPLHYASSYPVAELLINHGANPNAQNTYLGETPLQSAILSNNRNIVEYLVSRGADVNLTDFSGSSPLHYAAANHHADIIKVLLQNGAKINTTNSNGMSPLHLASAGDCIACVHMLLDYGARNDILDKKNKKPSDHAKDTEIMTLLNTLPDPTAIISNDH